MILNVKQFNLQAVKFIERRRILQEANEIERKY